MARSRGIALLSLVASCGGGGDDVAAPSPASFAVRGRWAEPRAITVRIEAALGPLSASGWRSACERALSVWSDTGCVGFRLLGEGDTDARAQVTLGLRRGHHGACEPFGQTRAVAHSGPVGPGTFVHFDADRPWNADGAGEGNSLFHTALHELGHVLGLGHSETIDALMSTGDLRRADLSPCDLAGLHSLYGGGEDGPGDLQVVRDDGQVAITLRRVAPRLHTDYAVFDTDGDGRSELLIWRTDDDGRGALMVHGFEPSPARTGPLLSRTLGPVYGFAGRGMRLGFAVSEQGERLVIGTYQNGRRSVRRFDDRGLLRTRGDVGLDRAWLDSAARRRRGDLDGDGVIEDVRSLR